MLRRKPRLFPKACFWILLCSAPLAAQNGIASITVTGNRRLSTAAILQASGLHLHQPVTKADLDKANQRLMNTGLFTAVHYRTDDPASEHADWALTLEVTEDRAPVDVRLDIPGLDEKQLWDGLQAFDGLLDRHIPAGDLAANYYQQAIESFLEKNGKPHTLARTDVGDLNTGRMELDFSPRDPVKITAIRFSGNRAVSPSALSSATARLVVGQNFGERRLREIVDLNVRPLYQTAAYLTAKFQVKLDAGVVQVSIDEGPRWTLGKVTLVGDGLPLKSLRSAADFPEGRAANWQNISNAVRTMERTLSRSRYTNISTKPVPDFHEDSHVVDLRVEIRATPPSTAGR
jgi:outer membrane protein assembly factor BamA